MEQFLRIWSIIVITLLLITTVPCSFKNNKIDKGGILLLIMLIPTFVYIIKF